MEKTTIKITKNTNKLLKQIKLDNNLKNMDEVIIFLIREDKL